MFKMYKKIIQSMFFFIYVFFVQMCINVFIYAKDRFLDKFGFFSVHRFFLLILIIVEYANVCIFI